jgi:uncharacterized membrane protein YhaH (DUF805 family)
LSVTTYLKALRNYAVFSGRATRGEFWLFAIVNVLIAALLFQLDQWAGLTFAGGVTSGVFMLVMLVPTLSAACRRLHDSGLTGVWLLLEFVPLVGGIALIVLLLRFSQHGDNQYGPDPRPIPAVEMPDDGGPPYAIPRGRNFACPSCMHTNPRGLSQCQWCHKAYREPGASGDGFDA